MYKLRVGGVTRDIKYLTKQYLIRFRVLNGPPSHVLYHHNSETTDWESLRMLLGTSTLATTRFRTQVHMVAGAAGLVIFSVTLFLFRNDGLMEHPSPFLSRTADLRRQVRRPLEPNMKNCAFISIRCPVSIGSRSITTSGHISEPGCTHPFPRCTFGTWNAPRGAKSRPRTLGRGYLIRVMMDHVQVRHFNSLL
jgi:hypothetical protein